MTEKEAFEAHMRRAFEDSVARDMAYDMERDTWSAAIAWLRSQGDQIGEMAQDERGEWSLKWSRSVPYGAKLYIAPQPAIPDGWQLVPKEPNKTMIDNACKEYGYPCGDRTIYAKGYRSMLAAAPEPTK